MPARVDGPTLERLDDLIWIGDIPGLGHRLHPERDALVFADQGRHQTYAQLDSLASGFAALIGKRGLKAGDRIAYLGKNSDLFYIVLFGAIRAGMVLVPINWRLAAPEISFQVTDSDSRLVICDGDLMPVAERAVAESMNAPPLMATEGDGGLRQMLAPAPPSPHHPHCRDQIILQLYTSGTTGRPKGVLLTHEALSIARHTELVSADFAHVETGCVTLSAMPNFHIGGMSWVLIGLVRFGTVVITADPTVANLLKLIRQFDVQHSWMVPTLIRGLVDGLGKDSVAVPRLCGMFYGAMPMDENLLRESMELFGCSFLQFFGMTEVGGAATALAPRDHDLQRPHLLKSVGQPYPGMSIEIRNTERRLLARGEPGEIWIKSPTMMLGYWNLPERTAESLIDGWYASGDGGYLDDQGYLYLTDRIKDMIVTGGENVYPVEVEQALRLHPDVVEAAVVGMPDPRWGERVVALVELRIGASPDATALIAVCRRHIAEYKCPKQVEFAAVLPRTASGKVQRGSVRQELLRRADA